MKIKRFELKPNRCLKLLKDWLKSTVRYDNMYKKDLWYFQNIIHFEDPLEALGYSLLSLQINPVLNVNSVNSSNNQSQKYRQIFKKKFNIPRLVSSLYTYCSCTVVDLTHRWERVWNIVPWQRWPVLTNALRNNICVRPEKKIYPPE